MLHTTFKLLKLHGACGQEPGSGVGYDKLASHLGGTAKYGKNTPIPLTEVLDSNGLDDALWCLRAVLPTEEADRDREARLLACDYAEHVLPLFEEQYPGDSRVRDCIATARRFALGQATQSELDAAEAAWVAWAAWTAVGDAARAAWVAWAAARAAARAAAEAAERQWQAELLRSRLEASVSRC